MIYLWVGLCAVACALTLFFYYKQNNTWSGVFKILASLCFLIPAFFVLLNGQREAFSILLTLGFGWSLAGDVLLIKTNNKRMFLLGLLAFLLAHLTYAWAFISAGIIQYELIMTSVVVTAAMIGCFVWLYKHLKGIMKKAVLAYLAAIGLMLITAMVTRHPEQQLITAGAVLFALSDLFVARQRFVSPSLQNRLIGLPLYYAGQLMLLAALFHY